MYQKSIKPSSSDDEQNDSATSGFEDVSYKDTTPQSREYFEPAPVEAAHRDVLILNHSIVDGKILVYDAKNKAEAWLVDARLIENKKGAISVTQDFLDASERPYNWDDVIPSLFITADDVRMALWYLGYVKQTPLDIRKTVAGLVSRGTLPVRK